MAVGKAIYELLKIKMSQRDYYAASHTANRLEFFNIKNKNLKIFQDCLEGVTLIMKKKFSEGISIINKVKKNEMDPFLVPLCFKFLGYAYFKIGKYIDSINSYKKINK